MNVGALIQERERLLGVIEEAKSAKAKLKQLNAVIAMYGDEENISLLPDIDLMANIPCPKCDRKFKNKMGLGGHLRKAHGVVSQTRKHKAS